MGVGLPHKTLTLLWSPIGGWSWTILQNIRKSELVMKGFVQTVWGPLRQIQDYQPANMEDRVQKQ